MLSCFWSILDSERSESGKQNQWFQYMLFSDKTLDNFLLNCYNTISFFPLPRSPSLACKLGLSALKSSTQKKMDQCSHWWCLWFFSCSKQFFLNILWKYSDHSFMLVNLCQLKLLLVGYYVFLMNNLNHYINILKY